MSLLMKSVIIIDFRIFNNERRMKDIRLCEKHVISVSLINYLTVIIV